MLLITINVFEKLVIDELYYNMQCNLWALHFHSVVTTWTLTTTWLMMLANCNSCVSIHLSVITYCLIWLFDNYKFSRLYWMITNCNKLYWMIINYNKLYWMIINFKQNMLHDYKWQTWFCCMVVYQKKIMLYDYKY